MCIVYVDVCIDVCMCSFVFMCIIILCVSLYVYVCRFVYI